MQCNAVLLVDLGSVQCSNNLLTFSLAPGHRSLPSVSPPTKLDLISRCINLDFAKVKLNFLAVISNTRRQCEKGPISKNCA